MFWIYAEAAGAQRSDGFEKAKRSLHGSLFRSLVRHLTRLEDYGVDPFTHWPYCITAISDTMQIVALGLSESAAEAGGHADMIIEGARSWDVELLAASQHPGTRDEAKCNAFEEEMRESLGWAPRGGSS